MYIFGICFIMKTWNWTRGLDCTYVCEGKICRAREYMGLEKKTCSKRENMESEK